MEVVQIKRLMVKKKGSLREGGREGGKREGGEEGREGGRGGREGGREGGEGGREGGREGGEGREGGRERGREGGRRRKAITSRCEPLKVSLPLMKCCLTTSYLLERLKKTHHSQHIR